MTQRTRPRTTHELDSSPTDSPSALEAVAAVATAVLGPVAVVVATPVAVTAALAVVAVAAGRWYREGSTAGKSGPPVGEGAATD